MKDELVVLANTILQKTFEVASSKDGILDNKQRVEIACTLLKAVDNLCMTDRERLIKLFQEAEKIGIHILRPHFYSPLPVVSQLPAKIWEKNETAGINWNEKNGLLLLKKLAKYSDEYKQISDSNLFDVNNGQFEHHDAPIYYAMIRHIKPKKIIEVGSGFSTKLAALACKKNGFTDLICIDPFPTESLENDLPELIQLIKKPVQEIPINTFRELDKNDILFIDSSHVSKIGSDVNYLFLYVLPNLKKGVIIHVHDIFLPHEIPQYWVYEKHLFWNEQYLLNAFLIGNSDFEVLFGNHFMEIHHPDVLNRIYPYETSSGSFWMKKVR